MRPGEGQVTASEGVGGLLTQTVRYTIAVTHLILSTALIGSGTYYVSHVWESLLITASAPEGVLGPTGILVIIFTAVYVFQHALSFASYIMYNWRTSPSPRISTPA